jgi:hypothetical protein
MLSEQARELICVKDEVDGESWSNDSDEIAEIMIAFAKAQITKLIFEIEECHGNAYDMTQVFNKWEASL